MTFKIFNCYKGFVEVDVGEKEINFIVVTVLQGDEVARIYFKDGTSVKIDACHMFDMMYRTINFYDGVYVVTPDKLDEWIDIGNQYNNPVNTRLDLFCDLDEIDDIDIPVNNVSIIQSRRRGDDESPSGISVLSH